jgi:hypothetical protein
VARSGISEFKEVMADFRQLGSLALKGVVTAPWIDLWLKIGPSPAQLLAALTSLFQFVIVIWGFHFWSGMDTERLNRRMKVALGVFSIGLLASVLLLARFTVSPGEGRERVIEGWTVREDVQPVITPSYTAEQALRDSEYDPDLVWTATSVAVMRISITGVWLATFASFAGYLTAFIMQQRRRRAPAKEAMSSQQG